MSTNTNGITVQGSLYSHLDTSGPTKLSVALNQVPFTSIQDPNSIQETLQEAQKFTSTQKCKRSQRRSALLAGLERAQGDLSELRQRQWAKLQASNVYIPRDRLAPSWEDGDTTDESDHESGTSSNDVDELLRTKAQDYRRAFALSEQVLAIPANQSGQKFSLEDINDPELPSAQTLAGLRARRGRTVKQYETEFEEITADEQRKLSTGFLADPSLDEAYRALEAAYNDDSLETASVSSAGTASKKNAARNDKSKSAVDDPAFWRALQQRIRLLMKERARQTLRLHELASSHEVQDPYFVRLYTPEIVPDDVRMSTPTEPTQSVYDVRSRSDKKNNQHGATSDALRPLYSGERSNITELLTSCQAFASLLSLNNMQLSPTVLQAQNIQNAQESLWQLQTLTGKSNLAQPVPDSAVYRQLTSSSDNNVAPVLPNSNAQTMPETSEIQPMLRPAEITDPVSANAHVNSLLRYTRTHYPQSRMPDNSNTLTRGELEFLVLARKTVKKRANVGRSDRFFCGMCLRDDTQHYSRMMCRSCAQLYKFSSEFIDYVCANDELRETLARSTSTRRLVGRAYEFIKGLNHDRLLKPVSVSTIARACNIVLAGSEMPAEEEPESVPDPTLLHCEGHKNANSKAQNATQHNAKSGTSMSSTNDIWRPLLPFIAAVHAYDTRRMLHDAQTEFSQWWLPHPANTEALNMDPNMAQTSLNMALNALQTRLNRSQIRQKQCDMFSLVMKPPKKQISQYTEATVDNVLDITADLENPFATDATVSVPESEEKADNSEVIPIALQMRLRLIGVELARAENTAIQMIQDKLDFHQSNGKRTRVKQDVIHDVAHQATAFSERIQRCGGRLYEFWESGSNAIVQSIPSKELVASVSVFYERLASMHGIYGVHLLVVPASFLRLWHWMLQWLCPHHVVLHYSGKSNTRAQLRKTWCDAVTNVNTEPSSYNETGFVPASHVAHICLTSAAQFIQDYHYFGNSSWASATLLSHGPLSSAGVLPRRTQIVSSMMNQLQIVVPKFLLVAPCAAAADAVLSKEESTQSSISNPNDSLESMHLPDIFMSAPTMITDSLQTDLSAVPLHTLEWIFPEIFSSFSSDRIGRARTENEDISAFYSGMTSADSWATHASDILFSTDVTNVLGQLESSSLCEIHTLREITNQSCLYHLAKEYPTCLQQSIFTRLPSSLALPTRLGLACTLPFTVQTGPTPATLTGVFVKSVNEQYQPPTGATSFYNDQFGITGNSIFSKTNLETPEGISNDAIVAVASEIRAGRLPLPINDWRDENVATRFGLDLASFATSISANENIDSKETESSEPQPDPAVLQALLDMDPDQQATTLEQLSAARCLLAKMNSNGRISANLVPALLRSDENRMRQLVHWSSVADTWYGSPVACLVAADGSWASIIRQAHINLAVQQRAIESLRSAINDSTISQIIAPPVGSTASGFILGRCSSEMHEVLAASGYRLAMGDRMGDIHCLISESSRVSRIHATITASPSNEFYLHVHGKRPVFVDGKEYAAQTLKEPSASTALRTPAPLGHGSIIAIDTTIMVFLRPQS